MIGNNTLFKNNNNNNNNSTNTFGTTSNTAIFGAQPQLTSSGDKLQTTSLFGNISNSGMQSGSLFGNVSSTSNGNSLQTNSLFGNNQSNSFLKGATSNFGFSNTQFSANNPINTNNSLFSGMTSSSSSMPTQGTSIFGSASNNSNQNNFSLNLSTGNAQSNVFGKQGNSYGSSSLTSLNYDFVPKIIHEINPKNSNQKIQQKLMTIIAHDQYQKLLLDELRLSDYFSQNGQNIGQVSTNTSGLITSTNNTNSLFANKSFGNTSSSFGGFNLGNNLTQNGTNFTGQSQQNSSFLSQTNPSSLSSSIAPLNTNNNSLSFGQNWSNNVNNKLNQTSIFQNSNPNGFSFNNNNVSNSSSTAGSILGMQQPLQQTQNSGTTTALGLTNLQQPQQSLFGNSNKTNSIFGGNSSSFISSMANQQSITPLQLNLGTNISNANTISTVGSGLFQNSLSQPSSSLASSFGGGSNAGLGLNLSQSSSQSIFGNRLQSSNFPGITNNQSLGMLSGSTNTSIPISSQSSIAPLMNSNSLTSNFQNSIDGGLGIKSNNNNNNLFNLSGIGSSGSGLLTQSSNNSTSSMFPGNAQNLLPSQNLSLPNSNKFGSFNLNTTNLNSSQKPSMFMNGPSSSSIFNSSLNLQKNDYGSVGLASNSFPQNVDIDTFRSFQQQKLIDVQLKTMARNHISSCQFSLPSVDNGPFYSSIGTEKTTNSSSISLDSNKTSSNIVNPLFNSSSSSHEFYTSPFRTLRYNRSGESNEIGLRKRLRKMLFENLDDECVLGHQPLAAIQPDGSKYSSLRDSSILTKSNIFSTPSLSCSFEKFKFKSQPSIGEMINQSLKEFARQDESLISVVLDKSNCLDNTPMVTTTHPCDEKSFDVRGDFGDDSFCEEDRNIFLQSQTKLSNQAQSTPLTCKKRVSFREEVEIFNSEGVKPISSDDNLTSSEYIKFSQKNSDLKTGLIAYSKSSPRKCGITLERVDYYTEPNLHVCDGLASNRECWVHDFVVGRKDYGFVKFPGRTNIYGLDLDKIVFFQHSEIEIYPESDEDLRNQLLAHGITCDNDICHISKPKVGDGLNRPAEVTLLRVWPNDQSDRSPIKDSDRLKKIGFYDRLQQKTTQFGGFFINYKPDSGAWIFSVNHFTKYGLTELPEFDNMNSPLSDLGIQSDTMMMMPGELEIGQKQFENNKFVTESDNKVNCITSSVENETDPLLISSKSLKNAQIQTMKVSFFFDSSQADEYGETHSNCDSIPHPPSKLFQIYSGPSDCIKNIPPSSSYSQVEEGTTLETTTMYPENRSENFIIKTYDCSDYSHSQTENSEKSRMISKKLTKRNDERKIFPNCYDISFNSFKSMKMDLANPFLLPDPMIDILYKHQESYNSTQTLSKNLKNLGQFFSGLFRTNFGSMDSKICHIRILNSSSISTDVDQTIPLFYQYSNSNENHETVDIPQNRISVSSLRILIKPSIEFDHYSLGICHNMNKSNPSNIPNFIFEKTLIESLFNIKKRMFINGSASPNFLKTTLENLSRELYSFKVMNLISILFTKFTSNEPEKLPWTLRDTDNREKSLLKESQTYIQNYVNACRSKFLLEWLPSIQHDKPVFKQDSHSNLEILPELFINNVAIHSERVWNMLVFQQQDPLSVIEYCTNNGLFKLGMCISVLLGSPQCDLRQMAKHQFGLFCDIHIRPFIPKFLLYIFAIFSNKIMIAESDLDEKVFPFKDIHWSNFLGIFLKFYTSTPSSSLSNDLKEFHDLIFSNTRCKNDGSSSNNCAVVHPTPWYYTNEQIKCELNDNSFNYDLCYQILLLYSSMNSQVSASILFDPKFNSPYVFDYSLSWFLMIVLESVEEVRNKIDSHVHSKLTILFAEQLESRKYIHLSCYVLMHHRNHYIRQKFIKDCLIRHFSIFPQESLNSPPEIEHLLAYNVPKNWIYESLAIVALIQKNYHLSFHNYLNAQILRSAQIILLHNIFPDLILTGKIEIIRNYISQVKAIVNCCNEKLQPELIQLDAVINGLLEKFKMDNSHLIFAFTTIFESVPISVKPAYAVLQNLAFSQFQHILSNSYASKSMSDENDLHESTLFIESSLSGYHNHIPFDQIQEQFDRLLSDMIICIQ